MSDKITAGKTYKIIHSRKGIFTGRIINVDATWATVLITNGKANALLQENESEEGEQITVRRSFCVFTEQPEGGSA